MVCKPPVRRCNRKVKREKCQPAVASEPTKPPPAGSAEVNIPEIVRKLQEAAKEKIQHNPVVPAPYCTISPCTAGVCSAPPPPPPVALYHPLAQQVIPPPNPVHAHYPKHFVHPQYVHAMSDNWSTTPTSTSTSISTHNNKKYKKLLKKNNKIPAFAVRFANILTSTDLQFFSAREKDLRPEYMAEIGYDIESGKTPISKLNELMQKRMLPFPTYDEGVGANGPPFIIFCRSKELNLVTEVRAGFFKNTVFRKV